MPPESKTSGPRMIDIINDGNYPQNRRHAQEEYCYYVAGNEVLNPLSPPLTSTALMDPLSHK
ncbi:uncharacterized protein RSE6_13346 [Rhynchosporium secalis]|uniref:Uncharacterized protein n=1 Tax=Rhynchosporium secalis TaxID=38038 RepID=A0A1E1MTH2_RHYSE|nr:uncharacterized protein RSE6_13346 [Rhynchosporium secalis]